uniref:Uncharacterized protein n=1 Tax=Cacopsylla melanoneura TaxID=428564 RepID=A0A8D8RED3_9HEMI
MVTHAIVPCSLLRCVFRILTVPGKFTSIIFQELLFEEFLLLCLYYVDCWISYRWFFTCLIKMIRLLFGVFFGRKDITVAVQHKLYTTRAWAVVINNRNLKPIFCLQIKKRAFCSIKVLILIFHRNHNSLSCSP